MITSWSPKSPTIAHEAMDTETVAKARLKISEMKKQLLR